MPNRSVLRLSAIALVMTAAVHVPLDARAQNLDQGLSGLTDMLQIAVDMLPPDVTSVRLGLGPVLSTKYEGSDDYKVQPVPVVSLRYRDIVEIDNNEVKITAFNRLFGTNATVGGAAFRVGPLISLNFGRKARRSTDLRGMGNVGTALELGGFASFVWENGTRARLRVRQDIVSGHSGALVTVDLNRTFYRGERFNVGGGVSGTWASGPYMRSYFGVSAAQAAASGYPRFTPGAAFKDVSLGLSANYSISPRWSVVGASGYKRLMGAAADSPIVRQVGSANQLSLSAFAVYTF